MKSKRYNASGLVFASFLILSLLVSSCTQRRYSHMPFRYNPVAKEKTKSIESTVEHKYKSAKSGETVLRMESDQRSAIQQPELLISAEAEAGSGIASDIPVAENTLTERYSTPTDRLKMAEAPVRIDQDEPIRKQVELPNRLQKKIEKNAPDNSADEIAGLLYIILVLLLILIILGLIKAIVGPVLWSLIILVAVIFLLGLLLGWW